MKVMFILPYRKKIGQSSTGFGIYVVKLAEELAQIDGVEVFVYTMKDREKIDETINGVTYIGVPFHNLIFQKNYCGIFKNIKGIMSCNHYEELSAFKKLIRAVYVSLKTNYLRLNLVKYSPDIMHVHACTPEMFGVIYNMEWSKKSLLTEHGMTPKFDPKYKTLEEYTNNAFRFLLNRKFTVTVVSSGMKKEIEKNLGEIYPSLLTILNGTDFSREIVHPDFVDIRKKYDIPKVKKILVCIGSLSFRKNQIQLIEAVHSLNFDCKNSICILLIGRDHSNGDVGRKIKEFQVDTLVKEIGFVSPEEVPLFLQIAAGNIVVSKEEGFGLSFIEGFVYGVPSLTFSDLSAVEDIYSPESVYLIENRNTKTLTYAIEEFVSREWDKKAIIEHSKKFTLENIARQYLELYKKLSE